MSISIADGGGGGDDGLVKLKSSVGLRVVEFFSGMGGYRFALERTGLPFEVIQAYEFNEVANTCYLATFGHAPSNRSIAVLQPQELDAHQANCWLLSPPCQPYTRGGKGLDDQDTRSQPLLNLLKILPQLAKPPEYFMLENVKNFETSRSRDSLVEVLSNMGYSISEFLITPWQLGLPNQRLRYYLLAQRRLNCTKVSPCNLHWPLEKVITETNELVFQPTASSTCSSQLPSAEELATLCPPLAGVIDERAHHLEAYIVPEKFIMKSNKFRFDIVNTFSRLSSCFTKAYGSHHLFGSGSLIDPTISDSMDPTQVETVTNYDFTSPSSLLKLQLRFFTPWEVAVLHGVPIPLKQFPRSTTQPNDPVIPTWLRELYPDYPSKSKFSTLQLNNPLTTRQSYSLLGNSLNVIVVAELIKLVFTLT